MARTNDNKPVIILIPAYQPGKTLVDTTSQLLQLADVAIVVVNDGSGADYATIFSALESDVHILTHPTNRGKGAALKTGLRYIKTTFPEHIVVTADSDGQHKVTDILAIANAYREHPGALLLGSRTFTNKNIPLRSRLGNNLTRGIFSLITQQSIRDTQTGLRAFDHTLTGYMLQVNGGHFEYEMNVLLACSRDGVTIEELPIQTIYENNNETSHFSPIKDSVSIYRQIIKFASSSLVAFAIDYALFIVVLHLTSSWGAATSVVVANIIARIVSASFNFTVNRRIVFQHNGNITKQIFVYALLAMSLLIGNTLVLSALINIVGIHPYAGKLLTEVLFFIVSYFVQRTVIFRKPS